MPLLPSSGSGTSDQRSSPMPEPARARRGPRGDLRPGTRRSPDGRRPRDESNDRTAENASAVTMPRATRSHRPSVDLGGQPSRRGCQFPNGSTPRVMTARPGCPPRVPLVGSFPVGSVRTAASIHGRSRRAVMANGVAGDGVDDPLLPGELPPGPDRPSTAGSGSGGGVRRAQVTSPARHSSSSQRRSYPATRAGKT